MRNKEISARALRTRIPEVTRRFCFEGQAGRNTEMKSIDVVQIAPAPILKRQNPKRWTYTVIWGRSACFA